MNGSNAKTAREERLAARLRDNLRRRKQQARAGNTNATAHNDADTAEDISALPKPGFNR